MVFVNKILKSVLVIIVLCCTLIVHAQNEDIIKIGLKDFHSAKITGTQLAKNEKHFFTSDASGKILMYDANNFSFIKTIRGSQGVSVSGMRLFRNDSLLLISQKYPLGNGSTDSVFGIRIFDNKVVFKKQLSLNFIGAQNNAIIAASKAGYENIVEFFDLNFIQIARLKSANRVTIAAISEEKKTIAYIEENYSKPLHLIVKDVTTASEITKISIPQNIHIGHLFFEKDTNQLFSLNINTEKDTLSIYNVTKTGGFTKAVFSMPTSLGKFVNISSSYANAIYHIILTDKSNFPLNPIIISKQDSIYTSFRPKYTTGVSRALHLATKNDFVFFNPFEPTRNSITSFNVFDFTLKTHKNKYPKTTEVFYKGSFLPNNNWMVIGSELGQGLISSYENHIKYYDSGTFNNRYGKLGLNDYLEINHNIIKSTESSFKINNRTGIHVFSGYEKTEDIKMDYAFYKYDLITDKVSKITNYNNSYFKILDFNNPKNNLLLYSLASFDEPFQIALSKDDKLTKIKGLYKFGKFSNNGDYLLTVNDKNLAQIRTIKNNKVKFEMQLIDGNYKLFPIDANNFIISNAYSTFDINTCNNESIIIELKEGVKFSSNKIDCVFMTDVSYQKDKIAFISKFQGIVTNDKFFPFNQSEFPEALSFNSDGSKLMVSLSNGKIVIYNAETLEEIGIMLHPDKKSHVFFDSRGYYFSNSNTEQFLYATKNDKPIPLTEIESTYYRPEKVLSVFGKPNLKYVAALEKALKIRSQKQAVSASELPLKIAPNLESKPTGKPNLYVLSIGVSDYQQSDYNLTFADKDALDMANIYGKLEQSEIEAYNTKFFGEKYNLIQKNSTDRLSIKKYSQLYANIGKFHQVSADGSYWLEDNYNVYSLWDFKNGAITKISPPTDFSMSIYNLEQSLFVNPDNTGFYIKTKNSTYYSYDFKTQKFADLKLPFNIDYETESSNLRPLLNNRWAHFSPKSIGSNTNLRITIGVTNAKQIESEIIVNPQTYYTIASSGEKNITKDEFLFNFNLNAISSNGEHVLYMSGDRSLFYINLFQKNIIPIKIPLEKPLEYGSELTIAEDGKTFSILETMEEEFRFKISQYDLSGKKINTEILKDENYDIKGFSNYNNISRWIEDSAPLVEKTIFNNLETLTETSPNAFNNTFVKYLTNKDANSKSIKAQLSTFFKRAKPNDQVIIFLAGHGVLDKDFNYYFAPNDMDFNNISKNGIPFQLIVESLKSSNAKHKLLLMDSCHSGNTLDLIENGDLIVEKKSNANQRGSKAKSSKGNSNIKVSDIISTLFDNFLSTSGVTIISASSGADVAYENKDLGNGAFTSAYIEILKDKLRVQSSSSDSSIINQPISLTNDLISEILKKVILLTNGKQVPDLREVNQQSELKMW